jgi:spermidine dehydrogenase
MYDEGWVERHKLAPGVFFRKEDFGRDVTMRIGENYFSKSTAEYFGVGIDATSCIDAWAAGFPGVTGMDLGETVDPAMSPSGRLLFKATDKHIHHFPDGNSSLARAIVRALIPAAVAGTKMEDLVLNKADYGRLDEASSRIRIRLRSPYVKLRHLGAPATAKTVPSICKRDV